MKFLKSKAIRYLLAILLGAGVLFCTADAVAGFGDMLSNIGGKLTSSAGQLGIGAGLMAMFIASNNGCWFCDLYEDLFTTMNTLAGMMATTLSEKFLILLAVGVLFYLVFKVGSTVVKLQEVDLMQFLGELFKQLGRAIIAAAFLAGTVEMYKYLVSPFLALSLGLTNTIVVQGLDVAKDNASGLAKVQDWLSDGIGDFIFNFDMDGGDIPAITGAAIEPAAYNMPFSNQLLQQIVGLLRLCSISAISGMVFGAFILAGGLIDMVFIPNFQLLTIGLIILGAYFAIFLAVPFKLIDAMVRLTFVTALTPLWIVLWVFPATASYTKNAWEMLLNCCACFICLGVVMVMVFQLMSAMNPLNSWSGVAELGISALLSGTEFNLFKSINILSPTVLKTLALGMLATSMIKNSSQIATQIVKSYGANIGDGMDKQMAESLRGMGGLGVMLGGVGMSALGGNASGLMDAVKSLGGGVNSDVAKAVESGGTKAKAPGKYTGDTPSDTAGGSPAPTPTPTPTPTPQPSPQKDPSKPRDPNAGVPPGALGL